MLVASRRQGKECGCAPTRNESVLAANSGDLLRRGCHEVNARGPLDAVLDRSQAVLLGPLGEEGLGEAHGHDAVLDVAVSLVEHLRRRGERLRLGRVDRGVGEVHQGVLRVERAVAAPPGQVLGRLGHPDAVFRRPVAVEVLDDDDRVVDGHGTLPGGLAPTFSDTQATHDYHEPVEYPKSLLCKCVSRKEIPCELGEYTTKS